MSHTTGPHWDALVEAALAARTRARAKYSQFQVGAALEDDQGRVYPGCNVESSSYGLTICAERTALVHAISLGAGRFRRIVVATGPLPDGRPLPLTPPCGACRQLLWDYCGAGLEVLLVNTQGQRELYLLDDLLPHPFDDSSLNR